MTVVSIILNGLLKILPLARLLLCSTVFSLALCNIADPSLAEDFLLGCQQSNNAMFMPITIDIWQSSPGKAIIPRFATLG